MDNPTKNEVHQEQTEDLLHRPAWKVKQTAVCIRRPHNKAFLSYSLFEYITSFTIPQLFLKFATFLPATQKT